ncbi:MarR family winged helix-turn-helix transcriptional regulator [Isoptericola sp. NPDC057653]|uniref:MarR family winged helix-turn-helix transcriptional regulator n=1 Tax=Isoptericola sp. NPDC057653 TaxID=3346195 RepID=UPI00369705F0
MTDDEPARRLVSQLRALTVELDLLGGEFARRHGLHPTDVRALIVLVEAERAGQAISAGQLAGRLGLDSSTVTALVDRMERLGHVRRERDTGDRRRVLLALEDRADELGRSFFGPLIGEAVTALSAFTPAEVAAVDRFLHVMRQAVATTRQPDEPGR